VANNDPALALLEASRALWGGEALVFRSYWRWSGRNVETDLTWLARQCHKEIFDGVLPRLATFSELLPTIDGRSSFDDGPDRLEDLLMGAVEEHRHFRWFAAAYEAIRPEGREALDLESLRTDWSWPENDALVELRAEHRRAHGPLGGLVTTLTEGGGATLYAGGALLLDDPDRTDADRAIGEACRRVHADEVDHVVEGLDQLRAHDLSAGNWDLVADLTVEQLRCRIDMRNAQFGFPLDPRIVQDAKDGLAEPVTLDLPGARR
jgi:hypothetical protein